MASRVLCVLLTLLPIACAYHGPTGPTTIDLPIAPSVPFALNVGSVAAATAGQATVTAKVQNVGGVPLAGVAVTFSTDIGVVAPNTVMTSGNGQAVATLISPSGSASDVTVTAGSLTSHVLVSTPAAVPAPTPPAPFVPTPTPPVPTPPFTVSLLATGRQAGLPSDFSLASSAVVSATWGFGDGSATVTTSDPFTSHIYINGGTYTATVIATDVTGRTATASAPVLVQAAPPNKP